MAAKHTYQVKSRTINRVLFTIVTTDTACYVVHSVHGPAAKRGTPDHFTEVITRETAADHLRWQRTHHRTQLTRVS